MSRSLILCHGRNQRRIVDLDQARAIFVDRNRETGPDLELPLRDLPKIQLPRNHFDLIMMVNCPYPAYCRVGMVPIERLPPRHRAAFERFGPIIPICQQLNGPLFQALIRSLRPYGQLYLKSPYLGGDLLAPNQIIDDLVGMGLSYLGRDRVFYSDGRSEPYYVFSK